MTARHSSYGTCPVNNSKKFANKQKYTNILIPSRPVPYTCMLMSTFPLHLLLHRLISWSTAGKILGKESEPCAFVNKNACANSGQDPMPSLVFSRMPS